MLYICTSPWWLSLDLPKDFDGLISDIFLYTGNIQTAQTLYEELMGSLMNLGMDEISCNLGKDNMVYLVNGFFMILLLYHPDLLSFSLIPIIQDFRGGWRQVTSLHCCWTFEFPLVHVDVTDMAIHAWFHSTLSCGKSLKTLDVFNNFQE